MPIFPRPRDRGGSSRAGFTLIELLVAMAIVSVLVLLAVPRLTARIESAELLERAETIADTVERAPLRARLAGRRLTFNPASSSGEVRLVDFELEPDWSLTVEGELRVSESGICTPGWIVVQAPSGRVRRIRVTSPFCETRLSAEPRNAG